MNRPNSASLHGWNQPPQDYGNEIYPGLGDPFVGPPALINPAAAPQQIQPQTQKNSSTKTSIFSNIGEWKQMLDRVGGIDGVLGAMGKFQKFAATMQQMAPLLRLFIGKGGGAATAAGISRDRTVRRRRRARRRPAAYSGARRPRPRTAKKRR